MTNHEGLGADSKIIERTRQLAEYRGDSAAAETKQYLSEYVGEGGILAQEQFNLVVADKRTKAIERYTAEREAGFHNDKISLAPGLTAVIRPHESQLPEILALQPRQLDFSSPAIDEIGEVDGSIHYKLRLPEGVYKEITTGLLFYRKGRVDYHDDIHNDERFEGETAGETDRGKILLSHHFVVRIEGDEGELWQNPHYHPDGSPTELLLQERARFSNQERS